MVNDKTRRCQKSHWDRPGTVTFTLYIELYPTVAVSKKPARTMTKSVQVEEELKTLNVQSKIRNQVISHFLKIDKVGLCEVSRPVLLFKTQ